MFSNYPLSFLLFFFNETRLQNEFCCLGFPGSSAGKESTCNAGDPGLIPGWEDPLEKGQATHSSIGRLPLWLS